MNNIPKVSLEESLYVLQLAHETALAHNRPEQAQRMMPLVDEIRTLVVNAPVSSSTAPAAGVMEQADFKTLLNVSQARVNQIYPTDLATAVSERNRLIGAMAEANMSEVDIARQFSMAREEVQLVLNAQKKNKISAYLP